MLRTHPDYVEGGLCVECGGTGVIYESTEKRSSETFSQEGFDFTTNDTEKRDEGVGGE